MFLPDPEYPWKWDKWLDGQPSEYLEFRTVGSGTTLHKEHRKHFFISASSSLSRERATLPPCRVGRERYSQRNYFSWGGAAAVQIVPKGSLSQPLQVTV
jgi:hypothetical protein